MGKGSDKLIKKIVPLIFSLVLSLGVGALSAMLSGNIAETYGSLTQPFFAPPPQIFPIVWTILYILMAVSAWLIYCSDSPQKMEALKTYAIQLTLNFFWSILFFRFDMRLLAFFWLLLLIYYIIVMIKQFYEINKWAAYLQIPYLLWCMFAAVLNLSLYLLNR